MKIRSGFVSNSSSSSFVVSTRNIDRARLRVNFIVPITSLMEEEITTLDELEQYFSDAYGCDWREYRSNYGLYKRYKYMVAEIENGNKLAVLRVSNDDYDSASNIIYDLGAESVEY